MPSLTSSGSHWKHLSKPSLSARCWPLPITSWGSGRANSPAPLPVEIPCFGHSLTLSLRRLWCWNPFATPLQLTTKTPHPCDPHPTLPPLSCISGPAPGVLIPTPELHALQRRNLQLSTHLEVGVIRDLCAAETLAFEPVMEVHNDLFSLQGVTCKQRFPYGKLLDAFKPEMVLILIILSNVLALGKRQCISVTARYCGGKCHCQVLWWWEVERFLVSLWVLWWFLVFFGGWWPTPKVS